MEQRIHIGNSRENKFFDAKDIAFIEADGNYCDFYFKNGLKESAVRTTIRDVISKFDEVGSTDTHHLVMVGRSHIFNLDSVINVDTTKNVATVLTNQKVDVKLSSTAAKALSKTAKDWNNGNFIGPKFGPYHRLTKSPYDVIADEIIKAHDNYYVDLGLPSGTLWAADNVGGPIIGSAWILPFSDVNDLDDIWVEYTSQNELDIMDPEDEDLLEMEDVYKGFNQHWGTGWHRPTHKQWQELFSECRVIPYEYQEKDYGNIFYGALLQGPNGNYINLQTQLGSKEDACYHVLNESGEEQPKFSEFFRFKIDKDGVHTEFSTQYSGLTWGVCPISVRLYRIAIESYTFLKFTP